MNLLFYIIIKNRFKAFEFVKARKREGGGKWGGGVVVGKGRKREKQLVIVFQLNYRLEKVEKES